jgi:hypothetical protein
MSVFHPLSKKNTPHSNIILLVILSMVATPTYLWTGVWLLFTHYILRLYSTIEGCIETGCPFFLIMRLYCIRYLTSFLRMNQEVFIGRSWGCGAA